MAIDLRHSRDIGAILDAIAAIEAETPRAALACQDAYAALWLGFQCGLSPSQIARTHREIEDESAMSKPEGD